MAASTNRILIETFVRKALRDIQSAPERSIRNLVDMGLTFSKGRFQTRLFQSVQHMLTDEHSAYYPLVRNIVTNVEHDRLLHFGMNVGYNSCTLGAKKIREIEAEEGFNIPWTLYLEIDKDTFLQHQAGYDRLICQGKELGIYTWFISADGLCTELFDLLAKHDDCAFALLCNAQSLTDEMLEELAGLPHTLVSVELNEQAESLCSALRERKLLYAVHKTYTSSDVPEILNDDLLYDTQSLQAPITALIPGKDCTEAERKQVFDYIQRKREGQDFATVLWDVVQDVLGIDTIISEDCCSAGFKVDGTFFALADQHNTGEWNLFRHDLKAILQSCLQK
ncbi:MAG: hypothetical protein IJN57_09965 [Oscillospiraceae bacterium]|nr:hypothetical protein [Oscillospiraceae bacterium]